MDAGELIQSVRLTHLADFVSDFNHLMKEGRRSPGAAVAGDSPLLGEQYRPVLAALHRAEAAARSGNEKEEAFFLGVAATLYGLIRLAQAKGLEETLRPRLERSGSMSGRSSGQSTLNKEKAMSETMQRFGLEDLAELLKEDGISFTTHEEDGVIAGPVGCKGLGPVPFLALVNDRLMTFVYPLQTVVPPSKRIAMAEAIVRANHKLALGSFEMDFDDGMLRYRFVIPTDAAAISLSQYRHAMAVSLLSIRHFLPVFHRIIFGDARPDEVTSSCES